MPVNLAVFAMRNIRENPRLANIKAENEDFLLKKSFTMPEFNSKQSFVDISAQQPIDTLLNKILDMSQSDVSFDEKSDIICIPLGNLSITEKYHQHEVLLETVSRIYKKQEEIEHTSLPEIDTPFEGVAPAAEPVGDSSFMIVQPEDELAHETQDLEAIEPSNILDGLADEPALYMHMQGAFF